MTLFPTSARVEFRQNPLVDVICQLRFPTILAIGAKQPADFQERIRAQYPEYARHEETDESVPDELAELLKKLAPEASQTARHRFSTADQTRTITLDRDWLAINEKDYRRWEDFREEIDRAKNALEEVYSPSFYSRIGLRYQNAIVKEKLGLGNRPWTDLINPDLMGLLGVASVAGQIEEILTASKLRLPELENTAVTLRHGLGVLETSSDEGANERHRAYVIDADFFTTVKWEDANVLDVLDDFNSLNGNLFRWAIQEELTEALEPVDIGGTGGD